MVVKQDKKLDRTKEEMKDNKKLLKQNNEELKKQMNEKFDRNEAVSYTHLDVYKRQIKRRLSSRQ